MHPYTYIRPSIHTVLHPTPREDGPDLLRVCQSAMLLRWESGDIRLMGDCWYWAAQCMRLAQELID